MLVASGRCIYHDDAPFTFHCGAVLSGLTQVYETFGQLNAARDNVVLVHHALSTDSHVMATAADPTPGWWQDVVGPGKPLDTERYYIICINNLGSCFGSTGPTSIDPSSGKAYGASFPTLDLTDIVQAQRRLLAHLGITQLAAIIGPSMGAMISLIWAILYPDMVHKVLLISSCYRAHPTNIAIRCIQREMITLDPSWAGGGKPDEAQAGFMLARKFGLVMYRSQEELNTRFLSVPSTSELISGINDYLQYNAQKFIQHFAVGSYMVLTQAMDTFDVTALGDEPFAAIQANIGVISASSDSLYPPYQQQEIVQALTRAGVTCHYHLHTTIHGHDAFLISEAGMAPHIAHFLETGQL